MSRVLLGVTGSVAAIRTPELHRALVDAGHEIRVVATRAALYFFDPSGWPSGTLVTDDDEWPRRESGERYHRDDPVLHIELRRWADVLLIAPLDANTLGKLAAGLADNCLTCVARTWDVARPIVLAPAMNTLMWEHPATLRQLRQLAADYNQEGSEAHTLDDIMRALESSLGTLSVVPTQIKRLACGDVGQGAMAEVATIVAHLERRLHAPSSAGRDGAMAAPAISD